MESLKNIWVKCLEIIGDNVHDKAFKTWFTPIIPLKFEKNDFTIQVPSHFFYEYLEEHYSDLIYATLKRITGLDIELSYRIIVDESDRKGGDTVLLSEHQQTARSDGNTNQKLNKSPGTVLPKSVWNANLNSRFTFNNFFESETNIVGYRIGQVVADKPTSGQFNPLYIYGVPGVGKTHLCHAIGNRIIELYPDRKVIYLSSHLFQVQFTDASRNNTINDFMHFYQGVDVLIIDDIQEFSGKEKTQNAYFNIFNHLRLLGKQIIITSDSTPVYMKGVEERLISRFNSGALIELYPPNLELRRKILHYKVQHEGLKISDEIINYIAENVTEHIRDLEGVIASLLAHSLAFNRDVDLELAERVVGKVIKLEKKQVTPEKIQKVVSDYLKVDIKDIQSKSHKREIVEARHVAIYLTKKHTNYSYARVGNFIGNRDHSSALCADKAIRTRLETDENFRARVSNIEVMLNK